MKKYMLSAIVILISIIVENCNNLLDSNGNSENFFALTVGRKWSYRIVKSDVDINQENFFFPKEFTVEISQQKTIGGIKYYEVKNYFLPGPSLPEPAYMRLEDGRVFALVNDKEYLLYSFDSADSSSWHLPLYVNPTFLYEYYINRIKLNSDEGRFLCWEATNFGRAEAHWTDVFQKGIGRTKILSFSQVYGEVDWELIR